MAAVGTTVNRIEKIESVNLESVRRVFHSLVRSTTMYAACVWRHFQAEEIEKVQIAFCKRLYGLKRNTPNYTTRLELGLVHTEVLILEEQLRFMLRILRKNDVNINKHLLLHLAKFGLREVKYNWLLQFKQALANVEQYPLMDSVDPDKISRAWT